MAKIKLSIDNACIIRTKNVCPSTETVVTGESFTMEWEVFNQGPPFSLKPIKERVFLSRNNKLNPKKDIRLLNDEYLRSLRKNGSYQVENISLVITTEDLQYINYNNKPIYLLVTNNKAINFDRIEIIPVGNIEPDTPVFITDNSVPTPEPATGMLFGTILITMGIFSMLKMSSKKLVNLETDLNNKAKIIPIKSPPTGS